MQNGVVIIDFETTGLSPDFSRVMEVGAALVQNGKVVETFAELMDPGHRIPWDISDLTGITNDMVAGKPAPEEIMPELADFIGERPVLAHNASFDKRFLDAEMRYAGINMPNTVVCTLLLARRLVTDMPNYKLGTLASYMGFKPGDDYKTHRALNDVLLTVELWNRLVEIVDDHAGLPIRDIKTFYKISKMTKSKVPAFLQNLPV